MPAPKSVLRDIHDRKLNPNVAHTSVDSSGRIRSKDSIQPEAIKEVFELPVAVVVEPEVVENAEALIVSDEARPERKANDEGAGSVEQRKEINPAPTGAARRKKRVVPTAT